MADLDLLTLDHNGQDVVIQGQEVKVGHPDAGDGI